MIIYKHHEGIDYARVQFGLKQYEISLADWKTIKQLIQAMKDIIAKYPEEGP